MTTETTNPYLERLRDNLRQYGGSPRFEDYAPMGSKELPLRWMRLCELKPHYKELRFIELGCSRFTLNEHRHKCMCGKDEIVRFHWIQRIDREQDPLIVVGSCCIRRFMAKDRNTFYRCATCNKFYKSGKYSECMDCRMRRDGKICTFCGDTTSRKTKICSECQSLNDDYERASNYYRRRLMRKMLDTWKSRTTFEVPCRLCGDTVKVWKARQPVRDNKCWTCFCLRPLE